MPASREDLDRWFDEGVKQGATHMIVRCDDWDFRGDPRDQCCYPVYVRGSAQKVREEVDKGTDRLMEVYRLEGDRKEEQVGAAGRVFNYE
jgi:hypothetical protein